VSRSEQFEPAFAVVRVDDFQPGTGSHDCRGRVTVKEVWWTVQEAEAEVERLNALTDESGGGSRYDVEYVRVRRR
jgi:hypothetical protein